jgi:hypothetical protein
MFAMSLLVPNRDTNVSLLNEVYDEAATDHLLHATVYVASPHSASVHHGLE